MPFGEEEGMLNRQSVYIGRDMKAFEMVRERLEQQNIQYSYKVKNQMSQWAMPGTVRGRMGSLGQDSGLQYEYEVFVHKRDYESAMFVLKKE